MSSPAPRTLDPATIERINKQLLRSNYSDVGSVWVVSTIVLIPCLILLSLMDGPLFAKVILMAFLCALAGAWYLVKRAQAEERPVPDVSGLEVQQLEGYFDWQLARLGGKPIFKYNFGPHRLHTETSAGSFFHGDEQLKLNRRYRVDAVFITGPNWFDTGYYLLRETFQEITDDSDLSAKEKGLVAAREKRLDSMLEAQYKRLHRIYQNPQGELEAIGDGVNFAAGLFGVFWLFFVGLYGLACIALLVLGVALFAVIAAPDSHWFAFGVLGIAVIFGACGNLCRKIQVRRKGFVEVDSIVSCDPDEAKVAYKRKIEEAQWHTPVHNPEGNSP
ncbi:DUF2628 domain-containing protein [Pseudomonas sp. CF161]|uniref:DUF2628 domain-containing protein n=1 Tax=Pseudomonas sp. CF161 TaxID=911241 RepID=UPI00035511A8|nr:DUF2628 domain-containing protein [Pseudomonas sp. CF161]EPL05391.1 hypothetical protein CF161_22096 [Pseudomonas sp. CF161]